MPFLMNGEEHFYCLLDTNIISEIINNKNTERINIINKILNLNYTPCIPTQSLIELRRNSKIYNGFLDIFSSIPFLIVKPYLALLDEEIEYYETDNKVNPIILAVTEFNEDKLKLKTLLKDLFNDKEIMKAESNWRRNEIIVLNNWLSNKSNFIPENPTPNKIDAKNYVKEAGMQTLLHLYINWYKSILDNKLFFNLSKFPTMNIMLYSQYYRIYDKDWIPNPQEVTDVAIFGTVSYMDIVICENFQAEIFKKIKSSIDEISNLKIETLRNLR